MDEVESIFRHLRHPFEPPPPDRELVVHEADDVQGNSPGGHEVLRAVAHPVPQIVLSHLDVQNPMQFVLDRPVAPDGFQQLLWRYLLAHDVVAALDPATGGGPAASRRRARPSRCASRHARARRQHADAGHFLPRLGILQPLLHVLVALSLVGLQRQDELTALADDQLRRAALSVHRVRGDDRALQIQHLEQCRQRPHLVGLLVGRDLAEHDPASRSERAQKLLVEDSEIHHVEAGLAAVQARKQCNHQHFEKVVARRAARPGILDPFEKLTEFFHALPFRSARVVVSPRRGTS